jgi:GAF domain-containing protein
MRTVPHEPAAIRRLPARRARLSARRRLAGALIGLVVLPLLTVVLAQLRHVLDLPSQMLLYLLTIVVVALVGGLVPALAAAVAAAVLLDHYFIPPLYDFDVANPTNVLNLVAFVLVGAAASSVVGLAARRREAESLATANAVGREEFRRLADEQAALRRVATLIALGVPPGEIFPAVAHEVGCLLGADSTTVVRADPDGPATILTRVGDRPDEATEGTRFTFEPPLPVAVALRTGRPARLDDFRQVNDVYGDRLRRLGMRSAAAAPIVVEGLLWGAIGIGTGRGRLPVDTEQRLVGFTELIGTAIANAEGRAQLEESRDELRRLGEEQAALRRVATLVARGGPATEVFAAVAHEVGGVLGADATTIVRLDSDGAVTVLTRVGDDPAELPVGSRWKLDPPLPLAVALRTSRAARLDDYGQASGDYGDRVRRLGIRAGVAAPIVVEGRLWGAIAVGSRRGRFPAEAEERMVGFTELISTAIANAQARMKLHEFAEEQLALRRVATLVARAARPEEVLAAVTEEAGRLLDAHHASMSRFEPDGATKVAAAWGNTFPIGTRVSFGGRNVNTLVFETGQPARVDDYDDASGAAAEGARKLGIRASVGVPISVDGRLWGVMFVASTRQEPLPADTEARLAGFTELIGTAIANAEAQAALTASRARIVGAADDARRRIERDLHDGTQQRLVALCLALRLAQTSVPSDLPALQTQIGRVADELTEANDELREIARGIHPAILSEGGLGPALRSLARRAAIPVELDIRAETPPTDRIEVAAYYVVSEALTNTTKHARASYAHVAVEQRNDMLHLSIRDDGVGGADPARGSGLIGLSDRVQALGGSIEVSSRLGEGTGIVVELPLRSDEPAASAVTAVGPDGIRRLSPR